MRKIITISILILMLINLMVNVSTASISIDSANLYSKGSTSGILKYNGIGVYATIVMYSHEDKEYPAYCLNKDIDGVGEQGEYTVSINNLITDVNVWKAITNGYPYKSYSELGCSNMEEAYLATKQAVYCMIYNRDTSGYEAIGEAGQRCLNALNQILNTAHSSKATKISAELNILEKNTTWETSEKDKNYIYKEFKVTSNATINEYRVNLEGEIPEDTKIVDSNNNPKNIFNYGEDFKIIMPLKNITKDGDFEIKTQGKVNTKPVLYGASGNSDLQDYALTGNIYEDGEGLNRVHYFKNNTKIIITKKDTKTNTVLMGVKFNLLDEEKNIIHAELETNENGVIEITNLIPGKYYIQETKTLEGYKKYNELIEVEIKLNETIKIDIDNEKEEIKRESNNSNSKKEIKLPKTGM